jgi:type VII secretion-associated serine protease mycosin
VPRFTRPLIAGVAALGLVTGMSPAAAQDGTGDPAPSVERAGSGLPQGVTTPVPVQDVTESDTSLRSTRNEVSVLIDDGTGAPLVTKLRADTPAQAAELALNLNARAGVVAAPTTRLRALEAVNPEPLGPSQWNLPMVGAADAWAVSQGAGVVVAVIDTGVDGTHPDLAGRVLPEIDLLPEVTPLPEQNGHGTRVASIIAGSLNAVGMAGVAPQATILPISALDPAGYGDSSTVARGIIAAADAGARVINLSLGGPDRDPVLDGACSYAFSKGAVVVAAGGNSFLTGNQVQYPAASPNVLAVASVDRTGNPSGFSNTGPHIDLAAPGETVLAAVPGAGYTEESGTSFAAPHVAAAVALVLSANPGLNAAEAASVVQMTAADDISGNGRDDQLGQGVVRADRAVATAVTLTASALPGTAKVRLRGFNALGEPGRRGQVTSFTVQVQAKYPDGVWRSDPVPQLVRFEFRRSGSRKYRQVSVVASGVDGWATLQAVPPRSGKWRARVQQPDGRWSASGTDFLKVRR